MMQKISRPVLLACVCGVLAGALAVVAQAQTPTPQMPAAQTPAAQAAQAAQSPDYIVGPGDQIEVFVWQNPDLSVNVPVRPDGKISTPLNEDMVAVGKTPSQLAHDIEMKLSEYVRSPHVNVIVVKPDSVFSQVKVIGQVLHPQAIAYRQGITVLDAVLAVGGLSEYAAGNRAHIVRMVDGKETDISLRLNALVNGGDMSQNLALKPGDVLVVPESRF
ncbi:MAG TPA: XrtA/PEP-CTERM system exopolysaccharide export protein [Steroidobacteraceae bacterium]|jgi:polysaccharide export outer membrane protein